MLDQEVAIPKLFTQIEMWQMSLYAEALRIPCTGTKEPSPTLEKQP